ncbi:Serine/threonine-protein kinase Nek10 isoform X2 [Aix galericulata]|nr:Serine/threonine-protein kinase Nek10 isoform X2 [Aix galericulata]
MATAAGVCGSLGQRALRSTALRGWPPSRSLPRRRDAIGRGLGLGKPGSGRERGLAAVGFQSGQSSITRYLQNVKSNGQNPHGQWQEPTEVVELENFSVTYKNERNFSKHPRHKLFQEIFTALVKNRFTCRSVYSTHSYLRRDHSFFALNREPTCVDKAWYVYGSTVDLYVEISSFTFLHNLSFNILNSYFVVSFECLGGWDRRRKEWYMETVANSYLDYGEQQHDIDKLVNMTYILQKIAAVKDQREWVIASGAHKTLVNLLSARDSNVLLGALLALISLAERLTAELLRLLCAESQVKEQVKMYEGIPVLLSLLHSDHIKLLWSVVWILVQVCEDPETSVEIRVWGGIKQLLHILQGLFPTDLFEIFIDIGHYVRDISAYEELVSKLNLLKVRKHNGQNLLAMKEVNLHNPAFGKDKKARDSSVKNIVSELTIIKEQLYHPNVVRYYRTFLENDKLYIVMELIDGVPLGEHFHSLKEKQQRFTEERIWHIFIQLRIFVRRFLSVFKLCLALRYLHKEKRIVHRDLTPNNVMLGDKDKVTVTDFGLAKQKQENSKLASVVGTILYSWRNHGSNDSCLSTDTLQIFRERAFLLLAEVTKLQPPLISGASVHCSFEETRPDIVEVSSLLSDVMMKYLDVLSTSHLMLEKKMERERRRTQSACYEKTFTKTKDAFYKHYEKLSLLSSTNGTPSCKTEFSENIYIPAESFQSACGKNEDEERIYEEILIQNNSTLENSEKGMFSELDDELDVLDNSSSSSPSHLKESPFASTGIAVSQRKVRQISDPVQQILIQLHKIIFITQLPPALQCNLKRRVVERFKKSLFSQHSNPCNLKSEMKKLLQGSPELIEPNIFTADWCAVLLSSAANTLAPDDRKGVVGTSDIAEGMTYEQLQTVIEEILEESSYYNFSSNRFNIIPHKMEKGKAVWLNLMDYKFLLPHRKKGRFIGLYSSKCFKFLSEFLSSLPQIPQEKIDDAEF